MGQITLRQQQVAQQIFRAGAARRNFLGFVQPLLRFLQITDTQGADRSIHLSQSAGRQGSVALQIGQGIGLQHDLHVDGLHHAGDVESSAVADIAEGADFNVVLAKRLVGEKSLRIVAGDIPTGGVLGGVVELDYRLLLERRVLRIQHGDANGRALMSLQCLRRVESLGLRLGALSEQMDGGSHKQSK